MALCWGHLCSGCPHPRPPAAKLPLISSSAPTQQLTSITTFLTCQVTSGGHAAVSQQGGCEWAVGESARRRV